MDRAPLFALLFAATSLSAADPVRVEKEAKQMGTTFRYVVYADPSEVMAAEKAIGDAAARVTQLNQIFSDYDGDSELMRLCRKAEKGPSGPVEVSKELYQILGLSATYSKASDGAFDVTVGPVVRLWRFARKNGKLPPDDQLKAALTLVDWKNVDLERAGTVSLKAVGMSLDLGGIAKGYAADEAADVLGKAGFRVVLVAASGDIVTRGTPPDSPRGWKVTVESLTGDKPREIFLKDQAVSTSGDAEQFVEIGGVRYSHIVDPKTGMGLTGRRTVTVVAQRGRDADPLTKLASVLPAEKAVGLLKKLPAVEYSATWHLDGRDSVTTTSAGFAKLLVDAKK